ncbi:MAG: zinc ribbon domain-containing protein [Bacteroidales bacterium]|nr:zinc ribbon domain-containing protein [Bacteroidales bacterium]MBS3775882.1 zinc ribbon domain-containing protein [Bacteroidales bacterium]
MNITKYKCPKCGHREYDSGEIRASGGFWAKVFNVENRKFISISCTKCGYTEFYNKRKARTAENILDFFGN